MTLLATSCNSTCAKQRNPKDNWGEHFSRTCRTFLFLFCMLVGPVPFAWYPVCLLFAKRCALLLGFHLLAPIHHQCWQLLFLGDWACMLLTWPLQPSRLLCLVDPSHLLLPFLSPWSSSVFFSWLLVGLGLRCVFLCCCTFATACWFNHMSRWFLPGQCFCCSSLWLSFRFLGIRLGWGCLGSIIIIVIRLWLGGLADVSVHTSRLASSWLWLWLGLRIFFRTSCHEGIHEFMISLNAPGMAWHVLVILFALGLQHIHVCPCVCVWNTLRDLYYPSQWN